MAITIQSQGIPTTPEGILRTITNINLLALLAADVQTIAADAASTSGSSNTFTGNVVIEGDLTVSGTTFTDAAVNTLVKDKNILINDGGTTAGAVGSGFSIEGDAGAVVGYIMTGAADNSIFEFKTPGNAGVWTVDINATKTWTVAGALNVSGDSAVNQDVSTAGSPSFVKSTAAAGTAAAPAYTFTGDTNTGIYQDGAEVVRMATAGTGGWGQNASQSLVPLTDNTIDIGNLSANARDIHASRAYIKKGIASTEGYGQYSLKSISASVACAGGATETIPVQVPSGVKVEAVSLRNDTLIVLGGGGVTYSAAFSGGGVTAYASGAILLTKNTKNNVVLEPNGGQVLTGGVTDLTLTPNAGTMTSGTITAVVYYWELTALTDAA